MRSTATMIKIPDHSGDFETLERMEWAFSKGELAYFQKVLDEKPSIVLRTHAVCMLADMKSEAAVPLLAGALQEDPSPLVRHEAAFALGQLEFKSAVPSLLEAMLWRFWMKQLPLLRYREFTMLEFAGTMIAQDI